MASIWDEIDGDQAFKDFVTDNETGEFWADKLDRLKKAGRDAEVLEEALAHLPLPGAFREAAIGIRKVIRQASKDGEDWEPWLSRLYALAVYASWLYGGSFAGKAVSGSEFDKAAYVHAQGAAKEVPISYKETGYEHLGLLNKTDAKWLVEKWGEPKAHKGPLSQYKDLHDRYWEEAEEQVEAAMERELEDLNLQMREHHPEEGQTAGGDTAFPGWLWYAVAFGVVVIGLWWVL